MSTSRHGGAARYGGSARFYRRGRLPYPNGLAQAISGVVADAGARRLLDVGCGPGAVTSGLAQYFRTVVGVDIDPAMIREARAVAADSGTPNATFVCRPAEELMPESGPFDVAVFAQSFHWLDAQRATDMLARVLTPAGCCVFVYGWTLSGDPVPGSPHPAPPYEELTELLGMLPESLPLPSVTPGDEAPALRAAGYLGPTAVPVPGGEVVVSTVGDQVARLLSRSSASPSLLGPRLTAFTGEATTLLRASTPTGLFAERLRDAHVTVWRRHDDDGGSGSSSTAGQPVRRKSVTSASLRKPADA